MELRDPVAAYNAATNVEAQLIKMLLAEAGIDAFVSEDLSVGGLWMFGTLPEIHKPQVWVSACDVDRVQRILEDYESQVAGRNHANESSAEPAIEVLCDDCGQKSLFPSSQRGSVQYCPQCGAHVDVGESNEDDPFWLKDDGPEES